MSEEIIRDKKNSAILNGVLCVAIILIFVLSSFISYQGMSLISVSESDMLWNGEVRGINPVFFWSGRLLGTFGTLFIWFIFLRKDFIQKIEYMKNKHLVFELLIIAIISIISWWGSVFAVFISTGFSDIQPPFADNAYIFNIPVYIFALITVVDTILVCKKFRNVSS